MKKILIVSKVFYPENSPRANRTTELAKEFARNGHQVTVYIPDLDMSKFSGKNEFSNINFKSLGRQKHKKNSNKHFIGRLLTRFSKMLIEYPDIQLVEMIKRELVKESGYDMLISIAVPHPIHWGVNKAIKENKALAKYWIADCGDPYMGCRTDTFSKLFYFKFVEKNWCKRCNTIVVPHEAMRADFYAEFHNKIAVIPQGFNLDEFKFEHFKGNDIPTFAYAGVLSEKYRNPLPFVNYLGSLSQNFKFIVYTKTGILDPYKEILKDKLEIRSYIPRMELLPVLSSMDFLVNFENVTLQSSLVDENQNNADNYSRPSKIIDYVIVDRPILSIGKNIDYNTINQFLRKDYTNKLIVGDVSEFDIKNVAQKFLNLEK
jgi:glycosyltransferase involved in cell wall biosynthesis